MRNIDILTAFEIEINKINNEIEKPMTDDSLYWLNLAVNKFVKLRFNGDLVHKTGFEQTEKRREDLMHLVTESSWSFGISDDLPTPIDGGQFDYLEIDYPSDFMYALSENALIADPEWQYPHTTSVFECTQDSFMYRITNSLTDFHYKNHKARPIRVRTADGCKLMTDKKYKVTKYMLTYIRTPQLISLEAPYLDYTNFDDAVMYEIIKMAAQMYLENIGDKRYQTITAEVNTQE